MSSAGLLFKFHLDGPIKQPCDSPIRMWGWIAAHAPIRNVILIGAARLNLFLAARPDVFAAHPEFAFAIGFVGGVNEEDLVNGTLIFEFQVGDRTFSQTQALPPNAEPAPYIAEKPPSFLESLRSFTKRSENDWYAIQGRFLSKTKVGPSHSINRLQLEEFAELFLNAFPEAVVLQIGASDGRSLWTKLLERTHWKGVLVEPIPHLADVLEKRFKEKDNVSIENSAIVEDDGVTRLYRPGVEPGRIPLWYQRLATVDRNIL
ncbi:MAG TPA: hypothetical protein VKC60_13255, partial [Opitutaceae bacterium]|nr:hypothetical protein [Opitutaceae bacterium]